uniref:Uncharacterized protein n=1 Tax=Anguilla anguilla TaxID=7936 RepID=A0A0E9WT02_ANGAN
MFNPSNNRQGCVQQVYYYSSHRLLYYAMAYIKLFVFISECRVSVSRRKSSFETFK